MFAKYTWLVVLSIGIAVFYARRESTWRFNDYVSVDIFGLFTSTDGWNASKKPEDSDKLFTAKELARHTNVDEGMYLSIMGHVFDVTKGAKHYGPDGSYHSAIGRDTTLFFVTGAFTDEESCGDTSSLSPEEAKSLDWWLTFYKDTYVYKGKLIGRFFDERGRPTEAYLTLQAKVKEAKEKESIDLEMKSMLPPCNIEWKPEVGTKVWCSNRSGGIERDWVGVPRMLYEKQGSTHRCACVQLDGDAHRKYRGIIRQYKNCPEKSTSCTIDE